MHALAEQQSSKVCAGALLLAVKRGYENIAKAQNGAKIVKIGAVRRNISMAEIILNALIEGEIDSNEIINGILSGEFESESEVFKETEEKCPYKEFVPYFLIFVKERLSRNLSREQILTCSPKRYSSSNQEASRVKSHSRTNLLSKFDDQDKDSKGRDCFSKSVDSSSKSGKNDGKHRENRKANSSRKQKRADLNSSRANSSSGLSSFWRRPSDGITSVPLTSTPQASKQNQKRRITPTLVTHDKLDFKETEEVQSLFEKSSIVDSAESSLDSSGSISNGSAFDRKMKNLEKSMRNRKRNERKRIPLAAFLAKEGDTNNDKKIENVALQESVEEKMVDISHEASKTDDSVENSKIPSVKGVLGCDMQDFETEENEEVISLKKISNLDQLTAFVEIYVCILLENLISNMSVEVFFLYTVLNCNLDQESAGGVDGILLESVESCVYFAAKVLEGAKVLSSAFDVATLNSIVRNKRIKFLAPGLVNFTINELENISQQDSSALQKFSISPSLGVPFQVECSNRRVFASDRYFYSFSKMRDKFYGLLRKWEESHLNDNWNIEKELGEKFQVFFFDFLDFPTYSQFSQLFVAQLIEMSSQDFTGLYNREEPSSAGFLGYLKSSNPSKFQKLQSRFFAPMSSHGPCPKPYFSDVENFFKLFMEKSCNYHFLVHLKEALVQRILAINSTDYTAYFSENDGPRYSESFTSVRSEYFVCVTEARILAKFLGYIVFSSYDCDNQSKAQNKESLIGKVSFQHFDPLESLKESLRNGKLLITVPWIVQYLGLMDEMSLINKLNHSAFILLAQLYRSEILRLRVTGLNWLFILLQLGWLFEQPLILAHMPFYQLLVPKESISQEGIQLSDWRSGSGTEFISKPLLTRFCPYINEAKNALAKTGSGSLRKIKPLTRIDKLPVVDAKKLLKESMVADFFKYKPKYFKETADFVIDRLCNNLKLNTNEELMPTILKSALASLKDVVSIQEDRHLEIEHLKQQNSAFLKQTLSVTKSELKMKLVGLCDEQFERNAEDVLAKLLPVDVDKRVVKVAAKIVSYEVKQKADEWYSLKVEELYEKELSTAFNKFLMGELKRVNRNFNQNLTFP